MSYQYCKSCKHNYNFTNGSRCLSCDGVSGFESSSPTLPRDCGKGVLGSVIVLVLLAMLGIVWAIEYVVRLLAPYWPIIDAVGR